MRCVEIEQLVDIVERLNLVSYTLYRTVSYLDRFLSKVSVIPDDLQFVCLSCMLIASKYEERDGADVEDVCYLTFYSYTEEQVVKMEAKILETLKYKMGKPTIMTFLELFIAVAKENCEKFKFLSCYLAELRLFDDCCIKYLPSRIAASVMFVAKLTLRPKVHPWSVILEKCTGYEVSELKDCVLLIHDLQLSRRGYSTDFVRKKYQQPELKNVANLMFPDKLLTLYFKDVKK